MTRRTRVKRCPKHYAHRDAKGQFVKWTAIAKGAKADRRTKAKRRVKSGYGHQGDQKR